MPEGRAEFGDDAVGAVSIATILYLKDSALSLGLTAGEWRKGACAHGGLGQRIRQNYDGTTGAVGRQKVQELSMQVILVREYRGWADDGFGGGGIGGGPASDSDGEGRMARGTGTGIAAQEVSAFGAGGGGDGTGVEDDDIGEIRRGGSIADTTEQLLHLEALVVVDFTAQSDDRERRHWRGIVPVDQASIFTEESSFLIHGS